TASARYREHGFEGVGIARLMNELGLTHGGFYAHFQDKEDLVAEASALALEQSRERMEFALREGGIRALIDLYLS
ncbi:TetR/AcrR family transcriptional regulator, partial [Vibrio parahaemolyticus]